MWKLPPIKDSDYIVIDNFDIFYMIAKQMKGCHYYYICKEESRMYGCNEEGFALHAVDIPETYSIPQSIYFDILKLNETKIKQYSSFVLYRNYPWIVFPTATINEHQSYEFNIIKDEWAVTKNLNPVDYVILYNPEFENITVRRILNLVNAKFNIDHYLGELQLFGNQENNEAIRTVFDNKASSGRRYLRLTGISGKNYGMFIFKTLFSLNKTDNLTIVIRDRLDNPNLFQASFIVVKKKSPIPTIIPFFRETTYAMFLNI